MGSSGCPCRPLGWPSRGLTLNLSESRRTSNHPHLTHLTSPIKKLSHGEENRAMGNLLPVPARPFRRPGPGVEPERGAKYKRSPPPHLPHQGGGISELPHATG